MLSLFSYGKEIAIKAYRINKILGRTKFSLVNVEKRISKEYDNLPIKKRCDLKFKGEDIMRISDLRDADTIGDIFEDIAFKNDIDTITSVDIEDSLCKLQTFGAIGKLNPAYEKIVIYISPDEAETFLSQYEGTFSDAIKLICEEL